MRRRAAAVMVLAALSTAACNYQSATRVGGATGVTVDIAGNPLLLVAVCRGQFENIYLSTAATGNFSADGGKVGKGGADRSGTDIGEWQTGRVTDDVLEVPVLGRPGPNWTVTAAPAALRPGVNYTAYALSSDTKWLANQVSFTVADLQGLTAHTVLVGQSTTPRVSFHQEVCGS